MVPSLSAAPSPIDPVQQAIQSVFDDQDTALMAPDIDGVVVPYPEDTLFLNDLKGTEHTGLAAERQAWIDLMSLKTQKLTLTKHQIKEITVNKTKQGATVLALHHMTLSGTTKTGIPTRRVRMKPSGIFGLRRPRAGVSSRNVFFRWTRS